MAARIPTLLAIGTVLLLPARLTAQQLTKGEKPQLPAPFATKSSGNPPQDATPPKGFLPTVPSGFHINIFAADFKEPRFITTAPDGDIFLADSGAGKIFILRDKGQTGGAQERLEFVGGLNR